MERSRRPGGAVPRAQPAHIPTWEPRELEKENFSASSGKEACQGARLTEGRSSAESRGSPTMFPGPHALARARGSGGREAKGRPGKTRTSAALPAPPQAPPRSRRRCSRWQRPARLGPLPRSRPGARRRPSVPELARFRRHPGAREPALQVLWDPQLAKRRRRERSRRQVPPAGARGARGQPHSAPSPPPRAPRPAPRALAPPRAPRPAPYWPRPLLSLSCRLPPRRRRF